MNFRNTIGLLFVIFCVVFIFENTSFILFRWFSIIMTIITIIALCYAEYKGNLEKTEQMRGKKIESVSASKNEFLSFATHQLRSPLTSLKWGLNTVSDGIKDKPDMLQIVEQLRETSENMIETVNDLLDISKIEQGGLVISHEPIDLVELLDQVSEEFRIPARTKQLRLVFQTDLPIAIIQGDKTKLRQVFSNIIDNAIKYTRTGSITINLKYNSPENNFIIDVTDTGPGISSEELIGLFEKFIQGNAGKSSKGGSGIGLYLGKKIIELHHGSITAISPGVGKGSTFSVILPKL